MSRLSTEVDLCSQCGEDCMMADHQFRHEDEMTQAHNRKEEEMP